MQVGHGVVEQSFLPPSHTPHPGKRSQARADVNDAFSARRPVVYRRPRVQRGRCSTHHFASITSIFSLPSTVAIGSSGASVCVPAQECCTIVRCVAPTPPLPRIASSASHRPPTHASAHMWNAKLGPLPGSLV